MTIDELKALAAARALDVCAWLFPEGRREKAEWLVPKPGDAGGAPVLRVNVGLRPGAWQDGEAGTSGADLLGLYRAQFGVKEGEASVALARFLGVDYEDEHEHEHEHEHEPTVSPIAASPEPEVRRIITPDEYRERRGNGSNGANGHRLLPASGDAEQGVICSFLLAPREVGVLCATRGLAPEAFHTPALATIYGVLLDMWRGTTAIDVVTLTQTLHDRKLLAQVGGPAYVSQLFTFLPTAANTAHYLDIMEEKAQARALIKLATEFASRAYEDDSRGSIGGLVGEFQARAEALGRPRGHDRLPALDSLASWSEEADLPTEPPQVLQGMLHQGSKMIIGAPSKGRKSWTLLDMAASVASGQPWWGIPTVQGPVLYLNFEVQKFAIARRLRWICKTRGLPMTDQLQIMTLRGITTPIEQLADDLIGYLLHRAPFSFIAVDPVFKLMTGRDENKVGDVMVILQNLEKIAVQTGAAIGIAHHYSKGNQSAKESIDRMGGSGAFARDPDAILMMTTHEQEDCFTIEPTLRNFAPVKPFVVRWRAPIFERATDLNPEDLKQPKKPERAGQRVAPPRDANGEPVPRPFVRANDVVEHAKQVLGPIFKERISWRYAEIERIVKERGLLAPKTFERWWMKLRTLKIVVQTTGMPGYLEPCQAWGVELGLYPGPEEEEEEAGIDGDDKS